MRASTLVNFLPPTPQTPQFLFSNDPIPQLRSPGADSLHIAGLQITTPLSLTGPRSKPLANGGTEFDNVTLELSNLFATGPATTASGMITQDLGRRDPLTPVPVLSLFSDDPDGPTGPLTPILLLHANLSQASLTAIDAMDYSDAVFSAKLSYDDGLLLKPLGGAAFAGHGNLSWDLQDIAAQGSDLPALAIAETGYLSSFTATPSGLFTTPALSEQGGSTPIPVPEPATTALLLIPAAIAGFTRRRRA